MKTLLLLRHAKAVPQVVSGIDRDRTLDAIGELDATLLGKRLKKSKIKIDLAITSPAVRAFSTAATVIEHCGAKKKHILKVNDRLYASSPDRLLEAIQSVDKKVKTLMIVGHNPEISGIVKKFITGFDELSPCSLAAIRFDTKSWTKIHKAKIKSCGVREPADY